MVERPDLQEWTPVPGLYSDEVIAHAGDVENLIGGVDAAHATAEEGVAGLLAGPMADAPEGARLQAFAVMQSSLIAGAAVKLFATHVEAYNTTVQGLIQEWDAAVADNFDVDVPEDATQAEIDEIVGPEAAIVASDLEARRQAAEDDLDANAIDVASRLEGEVEITDEWLAELFNAGALPVGAVGAFPGSDFMSQVDPAERWENLVASGVISVGMEMPYEEIGDLDRFTAAQRVQRWLEQDRLGGGDMAAEVALLLSVDTLDPTHERFIEGLALYDGHMVARAVSGEAESGYQGTAPVPGRESLAEIGEGIARLHQINDRVSADDPLNPGEQMYLDRWFDTVGADNLAALPSHVDEATLAAGEPRYVLQDPYLSPVADAIMNLSNPAVGGTDGLENMPNSIQNIVTTSIGTFSGDGRTYEIEGSVVSVPGIDQYAGFADLIETRTVPGGDQFVQELGDHADRVEEELGEVRDSIDDADYVYHADLTSILDWGDDGVDAMRAVMDGNDDLSSTSQDDTGASESGTAPRPPPAEPDQAGDTGAPPAQPPPAEEESVAPPSPPPGTAGPSGHDGGASSPSGHTHEHPGSFADDGEPITLDVPAGLLPPAAQRWLPHIEAVAREVGIDPRLLAALVNQESSFRQDAPGDVGEIGLTQLKPGTAQEVGVNPHDPIDNLRGGARYVRKQLDEFGSIERALAAYNAGPGSVARGDIPSSTHDFVDEVIEVYTALGGTVR